jgi:type II secretory pathway component PulF
MPFYSYKAIDSWGQMEKGVAEGADEAYVSTSLSAAGLYILSIRKLNSFSKFYMDKIRSRGIAIRDIIEFANNLSVMVKAGLPLLTSLGDISETIENHNFKRKLTEIRRMIELGSGFSAALACHKDVFPELFIHLVSVGEETGRLDKSLSDIAVHLQRMEDLKNAIKKALIYPTFALVSTTGALLFWLVYVLPKIMVLFREMEVELPLLTRILMASSDFTRAYWYVFFLAVGAIAGAYKLMLRKERTKYYIDVAKLRLPVVKLVVFNKLQALFAEQLRIMLESGLTIDKSFDILIKVMENVVFKRALSTVKEDILLGSGLHEAIKKHGKLFPGLVVRLIHIGEETGDMVEQLNYLSEEFIKRLNDISQKMEKMIEPIVIVMIGGIFLVIIAGLFLPIYDLVASVGK